jgi:hypothetical protein
MPPIPGFGKIKKSTAQAGMQENMPVWKAGRLKQCLTAT